MNGGSDMIYHKLCQMYCRWFLVALVLLFSAGIPAGAIAANMAPPAYTAAVKQLQQNRYGENDIKSFVHHMFAMYDYHVPVAQFYPYLMDSGLDMQFPEEMIRSHKDFQHWYDISIGKNIKTNTHTIESLHVIAQGNKTYQVDLVVWWQAETMKGEYLSARFKQTWTVVERGESLKIQRYIVYPNF
jgi:hypothetical protein